MCSESKLVISHTVGKRNGQTALQFIRDLASRLHDDCKPNLVTDQFNVYPACVEDAFYAVDEQLRRAGREDLLEAESIILGYHGRGADELVHRAVKDFSSQALPFKRFAPNAAFYYTMLLAFFLYVQAGRVLARCAGQLLPDHERPRPLCQRLAWPTVQVGNPRLA